MSEHTPTPWMVFEKSEMITTVDSSGGCIATCHKHAHLDDSAKANAALIVKAVNSYAQDQEIIQGLLDAAKRGLNVIETIPGFTLDDMTNEMARTMDDLRAAISKAEEKTK